MAVFAGSSNVPGQKRYGFKENEASKNLQKEAKEALKKSADKKLEANRYAQQIREKQQKLADIKKEQNTLTEGADEKTRNYFDTQHKRENEQSQSEIDELKKKQEEAERQHDDYSKEFGDKWRASEQASKVEVDEFGQEIGQNTLTDPEKQNVRGALQKAQQQDPAREMLYRRQLQQQRQAARSPKEKDSKKDSDKEQVSENDEEQLKRLQAIAEKLSAERENASRLRQLKLAAQAVSIVKGLSADLKQAVAQLATAIILRFCWLNIISSFGLTLIYINTHFLAKYLGGNTLFCEFGEEWTLPEAGISGQEELKKKKGAAMFTAVKIAEFIVLFVVDVLAVLAIIFIVIGFVFAILQLPPLNLLLPAIATYQWMSSLVN